MSQIEQVARALWPLIHSDFSFDEAKAIEEDMGFAWVCDLATAAIAAMQQAQKWQGIESAPMDGVPFLIWSGGRIGFAFIDPCEHDGVKFNRSSAAIIGPDRYNDMRPGVAMSDHYLKTATHWMPLPTPPAAGGSDAE